MNDIVNNEALASANDETIKKKGLSQGIISEDDRKIIFEQQQNLKKQEAIVREKTKLLIDKRERLSQQKDYFKNLLSKSAITKNNKYEFNANASYSVPDSEEATISSIIDIINQEEDILRQKLKKIKGEAELLEDQHNLMLKELNLLELKQEKMISINELVANHKNARDDSQIQSSNRRSSLDSVQQQQQQQQQQQYQQQPRALNQSMINIPIQLENNLRNKVAPGAAKKNVRFHEDKSKLEQIFEINANNQKDEEKNLSNSLNIEHREKNRLPVSYYNNNYNNNNNNNNNTNNINNKNNNATDPSSFIYNQHHHKSMPNLSYENIEFSRQPKARLMGQTFLLNQNLPDSFLMNQLIDFNNNQQTNNMQMLNRNLFNNGFVMPQMQQDRWLNDFNNLNNLSSFNKGEGNNDLWRVKFYY
jgi:hypothetical protein